MSPDAQQALRQRILAFAEEEVNPGADERDRAGTFSRPLWKRAGELGLLGLPVPASEGGAGLDALSAAAALEALGYGSVDGGLAFSIAAHALSCVVPVWRHGTAEQRTRHLRPLCDGTRVAANAVTEADAGSDAFAMQLQARPDGAGFRLDGRKTFVTNAEVADLVVVFAVTDADKGFFGGLTAFLVERGAAGLTAAPSLEKLGLRSAPFGELAFDGVKVDAGAILGGLGGGARVFSDSMDWERALISALHVGAIERILDGSVRYARERAQFGQPIGKFQAVSHPLADTKLRLEAARGLVQRAAAALAAGRSATLEAAMAKLASSEALVEAARGALQLRGARGYLAGPVERALRDALASTLYSGTSELQRNVIARWLGL